MITSLLETERTRRQGAADADCVRAIAARVVRELDFTQPPVDVEMVASYLGVSEIRRDVHLLEAGCLTCDGNRLEIRVRAGDGPARQRFTVCHECGHTFFPGFARQTRYRCTPGQVQPPSLRASPSGLVSPVDREARELEQLCDLAASELLLPEALFAPDARASVFALSSVIALTDEYEASLEATARRFVLSQPEPSAFVVFRPAQKPSEYGSDAPAQLRVTASTISGGGWPFIPRHKSVQVGGPFERALQGELVHEMAMINDIFPTPQHVEVSAQLFPYRRAGQMEMRVLALLRRPTR